MDNPVPWLRSGAGQTPAQGGCIMQVVDWIHRNEWTDNPPCVHPILRELAIEANDSGDDTQRQRLLDLAPRLIGTANSSSELDDRLSKFVSEKYDEFYHIHPEISMAELDYRMLVAVLGEYDRLTGRIKTEPVDFAPVCEVMARA